jgi:hypothetical protein
MKSNRGDLRSRGDHTEWVVLAQGRARLENREIGVKRLGELTEGTIGASTDEKSQRRFE